MSSREEAAVGVESKQFLCGVCEGFYGKPWSLSQRKELFRRMQRMHLNVYLYAPKDDYKHRLNWRDLYSNQEQDELQQLITAAKAHGVTFIYALSPGLDMTFSSKEDVDILKKKLKQVQGFGCEAFALLFDDIDAELAGDDEATFDTPADAQCVVSNNVYEYLDQPQVFLFCPTEYCTTRAVPDLARSEYLATLGKQLHSGIDILWTGPKVVSRLLTVDAIQDLTKYIGRPPVIWDNLHANDYDQTRLFLGPYDGRPPELVDCLRGVLTNPNCEFETNYIAMHTLAQWRQNTVRNFPEIEKEPNPDVDMEDQPSSITPYQPNMALIRAVEDWIPEFYRTDDDDDDEDNGDNHTRKDMCNKEMPEVKDDNSSKMETSEDETKETMETEDEDHKKKKPSKCRDTKHRMDELEHLTTSDILFICDAFYLPYEYGANGVDLLKRAHWLIDQSGRLKDLPKPIQTDVNEEVKEWYDNAVAFHERHKKVVLVVDKFVNARNRALLYQLYDYVNDMRSVLSLVNSYIKWHGMGKPDKEPFAKGDPEPWVFRGGLLAEFRRLLPLEGANDLFSPPSNTAQFSKVFTVRPYFPSDKIDVYALCRHTCDDGLDGSDIFKELRDLPADECIGALLEFYPNFCYILEDDSGICGYLAAALDVTEYRQKYTEQWLPKLRENYPLSVMKKSRKNLTIVEDTIQSLHKDLRPLPQTLLAKCPSYVQMGLLHKRINGIATAKRLMNCVQKTLKLHGSPGMHTSMHLSHFRTLAFHCTLGFEEVLEKKKPLDDMSTLLTKPI